MKDLVVSITLVIIGAFAGFAWRSVYDHLEQPEPSNNSVIDAVVKLNQHHCPPMGEYQIRVEFDSAYVFDHGRFVGVCAHGKDGIDNVIRKDNL